MSSSLSWIDFAPSDRERMQRTLELFKESETRDELGLGSIRDAISDALFPGTSTIQTRLKYFLFVPWHYLREEERGTTGKDLRSRIEKAEKQLIKTLMAGDDLQGVFGKTAGDALKRLPSSVYWAGLGRWQILKAAVSHEEYPDLVEGLRLRVRAEPRPDDEGVTPEAYSIWHQRLPPASEGFPEQATLALTLDEAEYLRGRITTACKGSLLGWLANNPEPMSDCAAPWELQAASGMKPESTRAIIELGRRFSLVMHGAALLYNLMLSELRDDGEQVQAYRQALQDWTASDESVALRGWSADELWRFMDHAQGRVSDQTRTFIVRWLQLVGSAGPAGLVDHVEARALVKYQEQRLKGGRSRFLNKRALDQWGGASGTGRLTYRWFTARQLLLDLYQGLGWSFTTKG